LVGGHNKKREKNRERRNNLIREVCRTEKQESGRSPVENETIPRNNLREKWEREGFRPGYTIGTLWRLLTLIPSKFSRRNLNNFRLFIIKLVEIVTNP
jgi:hypothetical protein